MESYNLSFQAGSDSLYNVVKARWLKVKSIYLSILQEERKRGLKNGLYDYTTVTFAYHTNKIEGSTLTLSDTQALYSHDFVNTGGHKMDDLIESKNHFELFHFMLDTINEPLTERLIKEYHQLLKRGTTDEKWYGIGRYKAIPNIAGDQEVAQPHDVPGLMSELMDDYNDLDEVELHDVLSFHHRFELIHPFQDGNGRIGRLIMFRQCLSHNITPFIISSERREQYIDGLKAFTNDPTLLEKEVVQHQEQYKKIAAPIIRHYKQEKNKSLHQDFER